MPELDGKQTVELKLVPGERIVELILEICLEAMKGQTPEQKKIYWDWAIEDTKFWRNFFKMGQQ